MPSIIRQLAAYSLLAVFGGVSLFGQGLHLLVPHDCGAHGGEAANVARADKKFCGCHQHVCATTKAAETAHRLAQPNAGSQVVAQDGHPHDCALCRFLAQSVQAASAVAAVVELAQTPRPEILTTAQVSRGCSNLYQARGPPARLL